MEKLWKKRLKKPLREGDLPSFSQTFIQEIGILNVPFAV